MSYIDSPLKSIDLFSGIGGITHALRHVAEPILYCDIDTDAKQVLQTNMERGWLPRAPIISDVRELVQEDFVLTGVDMLVGGWPCQDISLCGNKRGFSGDRSGLIKVVLDILAMHDIPIVFLENVAAIAGSGYKEDFEWMLTRLKELGYTNLHYVLASASEHAGAPHKRNRFFLMGIKEDTPQWRDVKGHPRGKLFEFAQDNFGEDTSTFWALHDEPQPRLMPADKSNKIRNRLLGNSVVPACVRAAFTTLACFQATHDPDNDPIDISDYMLPHEWQWPRYKVVLDPRAVPLPAIDSKLQVLEKLYHEGRDVVKPLWATPRTKNQPSRVLTKRTMNDLPTQVRFARDTVGCDRMCADVNPGWTEWLMGYPASWTNGFV